MRRIEIMDTTLRDGEQCQGVTFTPDEKLYIAQNLIENLKVDRIEVASCRVGESESNSLQKIMTWAIQTGHEGKIEALSFVDHKRSIDWLQNSKCRRINLLTKGSRKHCEKQLGKSIGGHLEMIKNTVDYAHSKDFWVAAYLEDWSQGIQEDDLYVRSMIHALKELNVVRIHLCDTLGVLNPEKVSKYVGFCCNEFPDLEFEFHAHNDYGLATANSLAAIQAGAVALHATVNCLGERAGNASLVEVAVGIRDFGYGITKVDERCFLDVSRMCETYSGKTVSQNAPIIGENVFTHVSGIHVDGQIKGNLYQSGLNPERFGRDWKFGLSKLSGKRGLQEHLESIDSYDLDIEEQHLLLEKINTLNAQKIEVNLEDLPGLIRELSK